MAVDEGEVCAVRTDAGAVAAPYVVVATHLPFRDRGGLFARTFPMRSYALSARLDGRVPTGMYLAATRLAARSARRSWMGRRW